MFPTISTLDKVRKYIRVSRALRAFCACWGLYCFVIPFIPPYPHTLWNMLFAIGDLVCAGWMWTLTLKLHRDVQIFYHIEYLAEEVNPEEYDDDDQMVIEAWHAYIEEHK